MASIRKQPSGRWRARYRDDAGKEHARHFERKVDGQRWLDEVTASVVTGQYVDPSAGKVTVREYARRWADSQVWRQNTSRRVASDLKLHILPVLGDKPMSAVTTLDIKKLVKLLSRDLAPSSVRVVYSTVQSMFRAAATETPRVRSGSPCTAAVKLPDSEHKSMTIPEISTVREVAAYLPSDLQAVVYVTAGLGLRPGECFGLKVADVNFLKRSVTIERQLDERRRLGPLKTDDSYRTIPLPEVVGVALSDHLARHPRVGLVFVSPEGLPIKRNTFGYAWRRAVAKAGADGLRLHDMRHVYASTLIDAGESVKTVQRRLGHASAAMTLDVYSHLWPDSDERSRSAIDSAFGDSCGLCADRGCYKCRSGAV